MLTHRTPCRHYHQDALNTLIFGVKHWYLTPPSPRHDGGSSATFGTVDIATFVNEVLPSTEPNDRPLQCTQRSGDVVYVPYAWGHGCFNAETSVGYATEIDTGAGEERSSDYCACSCRRFFPVTRSPPFFVIDLGRYSRL